MRKNFILLTVSVCITSATGLFSSCSKPQSEILAQPDTKTLKTTGSLNPIGDKKIAILPGWQNNKSYVTYSTSGTYANQYLCGWGSGITFGNSLPHPIVNDPNGYRDGELIPTINYVGWTLNANGEIQTRISGAYFSIVVPSYTTGGDQRATITAYHNNLAKYWADTTGSVAYPMPLGTSTGSGGSGFKETRGMLVMDHLSPTKMSVTSDQYKTTPLLID